MSVLINVLAHRELIENLVVRDFKARYKQSILGIAWAILNPLIMSLIYTLVGIYFLKQRTDVAFPVFAYFGLLFWNLFSSGLGGAADSLVAHYSLITKIYFPREVFPIAAVVGKLPDFFFGFAGLVPLLFFFKVSMSIGVLLVIPLLLILVVFTAGLGMLFACANLFYRDIRQVIGLLLALWMYLVPNLYTLEQVPVNYRSLYLMNPVATVTEAARRLAFPQTGIVPWGHVYIVAAISVIVFAFSYVVFKRYEPRFAESI